MRPTPSAVQVASAPSPACSRSELSERRPAGAHWASRRRPQPRRAATSQAASQDHRPHARSSTFVRRSPARPINTRTLATGLLAASALASAQCERTERLSSLSAAAGSPPARPRPAHRGLPFSRWGKGHPIRGQLCAGAPQFRRLAGSADLPRGRTRASGVVGPPARVTRQDSGAAGTPCQPRERGTLRQRQLHVHLGCGPRGRRQALEQLGLGVAVSPVPRAPAPTGGLTQLAGLRASVRSLVDHDLAAVSVGRGSSSGSRNPPRLDHSKAALKPQARAARSASPALARTSAVSLGCSRPGAPQSCSVAGSIGSRAALL